MIREVYVYIKYDIPDDENITSADKAKDFIEDVLDDGNLLDEFVKDYKITIIDGD